MKKLQEKTLIDCLRDDWNFSLEQYFYYHNQKNTNIGFSYFGRLMQINSTLYHLGIPLFYDSSQPFDQWLDKHTQENYINNIKFQ